MPVKIIDVINKYDKILILLSLIISLLIFLSVSFKSSGRAEQSFVDIRAEQVEQKKSIGECKTEIKENKASQDAVNISITAALNKNSNTNERIASILSALLIDHAALMKKANLYPHAPMEFDYQKSKIDSKENPQAAEGKMKPFSQ